MPKFDPIDAMTKGLAESLVDTLELEPEMFDHIEVPKHEHALAPERAHTDPKMADAHTAMEAWKASQSTMIIALLRPMVEAYARPQVVQNAKPAEPDKPPTAEELTGCRRGYAHRPGIKCTLCGDTGQHLMPGVSA